MEMKTVHIGDLGEIKTGSTPSKKDKDNYGDYALWIKPTDINPDEKYTTVVEEMFSEKAANDCRSRLIPARSICVPCIGTVGTKLTMTPCDCFVNQSINAVIPNEHYDNDYVYYLLLNFLPNLKSINKGTASGREYIAKSAFENIELKVHANIEVQRKIGKILSAYDDMIDNCKKQIALLEEAAQRLYREWFVDYSNNGVLSDIAEDVGCSINKSNRDDYLCYTPIDCLTRKSLAYFTTKHISLAESSLKSYKPLDILFGAMRVYFHKVCIAQEKGLTRSTCIVLNSIKPEYWSYLVMLMFSDNTISWATANSKESTNMPYINWERLGQMQIYVPTKEKADAFNLVAFPYLEAITNQAKYIRKLLSVKEALLPRLISGQINIE